MWRGVHWADAVGASPASQSTREHAERGRRQAQPEALKARVQRERGHREGSSSQLEQSDHGDESSAERDPTTPPALQR